MPSKYPFVDEQGGASRAEAAPSVQRNRESVSVSGLYFSPFRHIQTVFLFYLIFLLNYLLLLNMSHGEHVGHEPPQIFS